MKTGAAIVGMLASAAIAAGITGWWMRSPALPRATAMTSSRASASGTEAIAAGRAASAAISSLTMEPEAPAASAPRVAGPAATHATTPGDAGRLLAAGGNPIDSPEARMRGHALYMQMNCAGCHGYHGEGNMGPPLSDPYWLYGGTPSAIYRTLALGRPKGMPAWGQALPPESLWQLVAYLQSMGGTVPPGLADRERQGDFPSAGPAPAAGSGRGASGQPPTSTDP